MKEMYPEPLDRSKNIEDPHRTSSSTACSLTGWPPMFSNFFWSRSNFESISPFRHFEEKKQQSIRCFFLVKKKDFVIQKLIATKKSEFCSQQHFVVKKSAFFEASKKRKSFFFRTLTFFVRKRVQELLEELSLKIA